MINGFVQQKIDARIEALRKETGYFQSSVNQAEALKSIAESLIVISEFIRGE